MFKYSLLFPGDREVTSRHALYYHVHIKNNKLISNKKIIKRKEMKSETRHRNISLGPSYRSALVLDQLLLNVWSQIV